MTTEPTAEKRSAREAAGSAAFERGQRLRDRHAFAGKASGAPGRTEGLAADESGSALPSSSSSSQRQRTRPDSAAMVAKQRRARRRRRTVWTGVALITLLVGYYGVTLLQVSSAGRSDDARPADAIVVMGAAQYDGRPSPQLAARLDHVVELWPQGLAPVVVVTGGKQPGDRFTEAEASSAYLIERGIPESAILREDQGTTSFQSLELVSGLINTDSTDSRNEGSASGATVLIVTDPYHTLRSILIAREVGLTAFGSPTQTSVVTGGRSFQRHVVEAGGVAIGRLTGFGWLSGVTD